MLVSAPVHDVLRSPGEPLDATVRASMETRFGHSFAHIRVHPDGPAAESARYLNAAAYTVGRDKVRISYPARLVKYILQDSEFTTEFRQFGGAIFGQGVVFEPGQLIKVHNHENGEIVTLRVADLARFENRKGWTFFVRVAKTAALAYSIQVVGARLTAGAALRLAEGLTVSTASKAATPLGHLALNEGLNAALSIAPNVISQVSAYGLEFEKYNKGSIAFDLVLGVVGGRVANAVTKALPLQITRVADLIAVENVKNFTAQQTVFYLYGMLTAYAKALVANTNQSAQETAATIENAWSAGKSVAGQAVFSTPFGQQRFPQGFQSFSWRLIDKALSLIFKTFLNQWLNVTPKASPDATPLASAEDRPA